MKRLEQLPEIANKGLGGLEATPGLKYRILQEAAAQKNPAAKRKAAVLRAACAAVACAVVLAIALPGILNPADAPLINSMPMGNATDAPALLSDNGISGGNLKSGSQNVPAYQSIWADGSGTFPLICVNGQYYRMLTTPSSVPARVLGSSVGTIAQYTTEPALAGSSGLLSNACSSGTTVYQVSGMGNTLVAAEVNGQTRAFQRVGFNGSALLGSEKFSDTLQISGHVTMLELSGVGTIADRNTCESLVNTLLRNASFESSGNVSASQTLLISLDNGLTVQLAVKNDKLSACGTWSCPEFFDAFSNALR